MCQLSTPDSFSVEDFAVEETLLTALRDDIPQPLSEIATHLGYRGVAPLQSRYRDLSDQIVSKRRSALKISPTPPNKPCHSNCIEQALSEAMDQGGLMAPWRDALGLRDVTRITRCPPESLCRIESRRQQASAG